MIRKLAPPSLFMKKAENKGPRYVVGLDIETTSLVPAAGSIIEVAAIRFDRHELREVDRFVRLCKPDQPLTTEITAITGITAEMVANESPFGAYIRDLRDFVGNDLIFAHNANFDVGFLSHHGLVLSNPVWDTFYLASVALPEAASYNLAMLAEQLEIALEGEHRAVADVLVTWQLLQKLTLLVTSGPQTYQRIQSILQGASLGHYQPLFRGTSKAVTPKNTVYVATPSTAGTKISSIDEMFSIQGPLATNISGFIVRPGQKEMAKAVHDAIIQGHTALMEAATGTGKTYAYLAAALLAAANGQRSIISTHTKHLQDQLMDKDVPTITRALGYSPTVAVLKGRGNYVCSTSLARVLERGVSDPAEAWVTLKILLWLERGGNGDMDRLNVSHSNVGIMRRIHADSLICRLQCQDPACSYRRARALALDARIVLINHALLVTTDWSREADQAPVVIIDEAHHVEDAAREASGIDLSLTRVQESLEPIVTLARAHEQSTSAKHLISESEELVEQYGALLRDVHSYVERHTAQNRLQLTPQARRSSQWQKIHKLFQAWEARLKFVIGLSGSLGEGINSHKKRILVEALAELERLVVQTATFFDGAVDRIQWIQAGWSDNPHEVPMAKLRDTALNVSNMLAPLFAQARAVILTSATLAIQGDYTYIKRQLGLPSTTIEYTYESPFSFKKDMLVYILENSNVPGSLAFDEFTAATIIRIARILRGRTLVLMTSKEGVKSVYRKALTGLSKETISLLAQGMSGGRSKILKRFKDLDQAVLIGTSSFWEGVDVPGESLSCVVIPKLPFAPPDDPVISSIAAAQHVNAFRDIAVPRMLLKVRQGVGRLLRTTSDRGVVVLLDPRIHTSDYGNDVIKSMPPATIHIGDAGEITTKIERWFGAETVARWQSSTGKKTT